MTSPFANIFLALTQRINTVIPEITYIDLDYGQLDTRERPAVNFPCLLINFDRYTFTEVSQKVQQATGTLLLKLVTDPHSSSSNITPDTYREAALEILELEQALFQALHGWKPTLTILANPNADPPAEEQIITIGTPLIRTSYTPDNRRPGIRVQHLAFSHSFDDYSARSGTHRISAPPNITTSITV